MTAHAWTRTTRFGCLLTTFFWTAFLLAAVTLLVAAWPLVIAAAWGYAVAWARGWPPRRLLAAAWSLPMPAVVALAYGLQTRSWQAAAWSPVDAYLIAWGHLSAGTMRDWLTATVIVAPTAIPLGLLLAAGLWQRRIGAMEAGTAGWTPYAPAHFDARQWARQARTAHQRARAPGGVPLLSRRGNPQLGATICAIGHRPRPVLELPYARLRTHMLIVGTTGAGKTTALVRLWAGFWAAAARRFLAGKEARPWLVIADAKGGFDSRDTADEARRVLADVGAHLVIWPDEAALNLWALPPQRLTEVLTDLVPTADEGPAAYYADVLTSAVSLAVHAPPTPPESSADFLTRLNPDWLATAYAGQPAAAHVHAAAPHLGDIALRYRTLFTRLGPGFDGSANVTDFDALYCILEGTASVDVAEAQARAITELVAHAATTWRPHQPGHQPNDNPDNRPDDSPGGDREEPRAGLLALDEFSAVSAVPLHELTERCRSLGLAVQIAAQSWDGLADEDDERSRLAATAAGGVLLMRTPSPGELVDLAGTRRALEVGRKLLGGAVRGYGDEGTGRLQHAWVVDPDRVRDLQAGQAAYIHGNAATYVHVAPHRPSPLAIPPPHHPDQPIIPEPRDQPEPTPQQPPDSPGPLDGLDDVFPDTPHRPDDQDGR
ncbi:MAG: hypothetical protein GEV03_15030 [Streptosporangiales bacterium]|nr:hypothetical protein [Streptosporangiales bacterium]